MHLQVPLLYIHRSNQLVSSCRVEDHSRLLVQGRKNFHWRIQGGSRGSGPPFSSIKKNLKWKEKEKEKRRERKKEKAKREIMSESKSSVEGVPICDKIIF